MFGEKLLGLGIHRNRDGFGAGDFAGELQFGAERLWRLRYIVGFRRLTRAVLGRAAHFQQGIAQQLGLDKGGEFKVAKLQQPDGLHQLRGQGQALRLSYLEPRHQRHCVWTFL